MTVRIARVLLAVAACLGALCAAASLLCVALDARVLLVTSGSMAPAIDAGAAVVVREVPVGELRVGDVVSVAGAEGSRVLHRVVAIDPGSAPEERQLVLQGDANRTPDPSAYRVQGADREVVAVPWLGYAVAWLASPLGLLVAGGLILGAAVVVRRSGTPDAQLAGARRGHAPPRHARSRHAGSRPARSSRAMARIGAALSLLLIATSAGWLGGRVGAAAAAFTDQAVVTGGTLGTTTVLAPDSVSCSGGGLLATSITISWPHKDLGYNYQVLVRDAANAVRATYTVTGAGAVGSTQSQAIPGGLLGSLGLGTYYSTVEVRSQLKANAAWLSAAMRTWTYREVVIVAGLSIYCT